MTLLTTTDVHTMLGAGITVQVTDIETGRSVARGWFQQYSHIWPSVAQTVADWYEVEPTEVHLIETDDGEELIGIRGDIVAKYEHVR